MIGSSTPLIPWLWFHIPCFKAPLLLNKVEEIAGFSEIDREEQNRIQKMIEDQSIFSFTFLLYSFIYLFSKFWIK